MKKLSLAFFCLILIFSLSISVAAETDSATYTFTRSVGNKTVATKAIYNPQANISMGLIGSIETTGEIKDTKADGNGNLYVLTAKGSIYKFNKDFSAFTEMQVYQNGEKVDFSGAEGMLIISDNSFYICDTEHNRVLLVENGEVKQTVSNPTSDLIPEDFVFQPSKISVNKNGYLYVVSKGCYYGALLFTPEGEFTSFYGANTVSGSILTSLTNVWNRLTQNDIKRSKTKKVLPYDFSDIYTDENGFVYTVSGTNSNGNLGQIRMLSPGGSNILINCDSTNFGEEDSVVRLNEKLRQNFCSIAVDEDGFIYALDSAYGFIYVYDNRSNLMAAFGGGRGLGNQKGTFAAANSLTYSNGKLFVSDSFNHNITVYEKTEFGSLYLTAQKYTNQSDYTSAKPYWEKVLNEDSMNLCALEGLGNAAYYENDYKTAMRYAKQAGDTALYSSALSKVQEEFYGRNFAWLFPLAVAGVTGLVVIILISVKKKIVIIKNIKLHNCVTAMFHPFKSFYDIKYRNQGSVTLAVALTALYFLSAAFCTICSDFRYTSFDASNYNVAFQLVQTIGIIALWTVGNWGMSSLTGGKGKIKEVFIVTAYSTVPLILFNIISTPLSHILASESDFAITALRTISYILCGIVMCVGLMTIHEEGFTKVLALAFLTVVLMIFIVFVLFMIAILLTQFYGFVRDVVSEVIQWNKLK